MFLPFRCAASASVITVFWILGTPGAEAQSLTVQEWVDQFVTSCVGQGSSDIASGLVDANGDISLKKLALSGTVKGQVHLEHKDAHLLTEGINNAMSAVAASEADQVRQCLAPLRQVLVRVMQLQYQSSTSNNSTVILSPEEDVFIKALANTSGYFGKIGEAVPESKIKAYTKLGDIRYRMTLKRISEYGYAFSGINTDQGETVSLSPAGDEYAINSGLAN